MSHRRVSWGDKEQPQHHAPRRGHPTVRRLQLLLTPGLRQRPWRPARGCGQHRGRQAAVGSAARARSAGRVAVAPRPPAETQPARVRRRRAWSCGTGEGASSALTWHFAWPSRGQSQTAALWSASVQPRVEQHGVPRHGAQRQPGGLPCACPAAAALQSALPFAGAQRGRRVTGAPARGEGWPTLRVAPSCMLQPRVCR